MIGLHTLESCLHLGRWREQETKVKDTNKMYSKILLAVRYINPAKARVSNLTALLLLQKCYYLQGGFCCCFCFYFF